MVTKFSDIFSGWQLHHVVQVYQCFKNCDSVRVFGIRTMMMEMESSLWNTSNLNHWCGCSARRFYWTKDRSKVKHTQYTYATACIHRQWSHFIWIICRQITFSIHLRLMYDIRHKLYSGESEMNLVAATWPNSRTMCFPQPPRQQLYYKFRQQSLLHINHKLPILPYLSFSWVWSFGFWHHVVWYMFTNLSLKVEAAVSSKILVMIYRIMCCHKPKKIWKTPQLLQLQDIKLHILHGLLHCINPYLIISNSV